jgi:hypothetical protein
MVLKYRERAMSDEENKYYAVNGEVREWLEAVLNIVAQASTLQYNEEARHGMLGLTESLAEYFDIPVTYIEDEDIPEDEDDDFDVESGTVH